MNYIITLISAVAICALVLFPKEAEPTTIERTDVHSASAQCLALNVYHEARGQGTAGLFGVTAVVLNRVNDSRFPNTICGVIYQGPTRESWKTRIHKNLPTEDRIYYPIKHKCQFSWYCDGKDDTPYNT